MAYVALTKPRIIELLLVTTVPAMFLGPAGVPVPVAGARDPASAATSPRAAPTRCNMYIDRDIDALMDRTSQRPLVTGMVSPRECLVFGIVLAVVVHRCWFGRAWSTGSSAALAARRDPLLRRRLHDDASSGAPPQNIVWGGIAGCMPVLIGWSAVTARCRWAPSCSSASSSSGRRRTTGRCR